MRFEREIKWVAVVVSVVLLVGIGFLIVESQRETKDAKAVEEALEKKALPYRKEISDIQNDLATKKAEWKEQEIGSLASVAFVVSSVEEAKIVKKQTENVRVPISIVLNDTMKLDVAEEVLRILDASRYDYIVTATNLEKTGWNSADQLETLLGREGDSTHPGFLLLQKEDTEKHLEELKERGYTTILRYRKELDSGKINENQYFFPYSIIKEAGVTEMRLNHIYNNSANMFFVYHMGAVHEGMLSEAELEEEIEQLEQAKEQEKIRIIGLKDMDETFMQQSKKNGELQQEYKDYEAKQLDKIAELERAIDEIYAE